MGSTDLNRLEIQARTLQESSPALKTAYLGALNMKKAGLLKEPSEKLKLFKKGHQQLEDCIQKDSANLELRFLRLMIQENSPKILNYHANQSQDAAYLRKNYRKLDEVTKKALFSYSQKSKSLPVKDLEERHD